MRNLMMKAARTVGFATLCVASYLTWPGPQNLSAQSVIVDPTAPSAKRATITRSGNNKPQIDIVAPSSGVSHNRFTGFSVTTNGLILNNSSTSGSSRTGGTISGNSNLTTTGPATVILNEVRGSGGSTLVGTTEVFGGKATVIIANPNGVVCNGCAFLNTNTTTLTTGRPVVNGGQVDLHVSKGTVRIDRGGFKTEGNGGLVGRYVIIDGRTTAANDLKISGGSQYFNHNTGVSRAAPISSAKSLPFAVDATIYGALTAGKIRVHGNESGMGVQTLGTVTSRGNVNLTSKGGLSYRKITAGGSGTITASHDIHQFGTATFGTNVAIRGNTYQLYRNHKLIANGVVDIKTDDYVIINGEVEADTIKITAKQTILNTGFVMADGDLEVVAGESLTNARRKVSQHNVEYNPLVLANLEAWQTMALQDDPLGAYARLQLENAEIKTLIDQYVAAGATLTGRNVLLTSTKSTVLNNGGAISATRDVRIIAALDIKNTYQSTLHKLDDADGCGDSDCGYSKTFNAGEILSGQDLFLTAGRDIVNEASHIAARRNIVGNAGRDILNYLARSKFIIDNDQSTTVSLTYTTPEICQEHNECYGGYSGTLTGIKSTGTHDESLVLAPGKIFTLIGDITLTAGDRFRSVASEVSSGRDLTINTGGSAWFSESINQATDYTITRTPYVTTQTVERGDGWDSTETVVATDENTLTDQNRVYSGSVLVGRNISINSVDSIGAISVRFLAENDLSLNSSNGHIYVTSSAVGPAYRSTYRAPVRFHARKNNWTINAFYRSDAESFNRFLDNAQLLTAVEVLYQANHGRYIRAAARSVGAQSWTGTRTLVNDNWYIENIVAGKKSFASALSRRLLPDLRDTGEAGFYTKLTQKSRTFFANIDWRYMVNDGLDQFEKSSRGLLYADHNLNLDANQEVRISGKTTISAGNDMRVNAGSHIIVLAMAKHHLERDHNWLISQALDRNYEESGHDWWTAVSNINSEGLYSYKTEKDRVWNETTKSWDITYEWHKVSDYVLTSTMLTAGGDLTLFTKRQFRNYASAISAGGNLTVVANGHIHNQALRYNFTLTAKHECVAGGCGQQGHEYRAAELLAGAGLVLNSGYSINNTGGTIAAEGSMMIDAGGSITNTALTSQYLYHYEKESSFFGINKKKVLKYRGVIARGNLSTTLGDITITSGNDIRSTASKISAGGNVALEAANDIKLEAASIELKNYYKKSGFGFFYYASDKVQWNEFSTALSQVEGNSISASAGNNFLGIGAALLAAQDIALSAENDLTFDAHQNTKYVNRSGWSIGVSFTGFDIIKAATQADGQALIEAYVATNPALAAVHQLATARGKWGTINGLINFGYKVPGVLDAIGKESINNVTQLTEAFANQFNPFSELKDNKLLNGRGSYLTGITFRVGAYKSRQSWTESHVSRLVAAQDLIIGAGNDLALAGGTAVSGGRDVDLVAGNNLLVTALADSQHSSASSWGASLGFTASGFSIGGNYATSRSSARLYTNATITAGETLTAISGKDMVFGGANVLARDIYIDAGRDLVVQSRQNVSSSSNFGFNFNVSFGPSGPTGLSIGGYYGDGNRQYTDSPTTIVARRTLDIYTGRTTYLLGAMLNSKSGDLRLDTDDFIFDHFEDTDKNIQVGGGISFDLNNLTNSDAHGSLQYRNKEGLTYATVGFGQIVVRGDKRDLSGLNRDVENLQVTTQNINFKIAIPGVNLKKLADEIKGAAATIAAATADIPQPIRDRGEQAVDQYRDAILGGLSGAQLRAWIASPAAATSLRYRELYKHISNIAGNEERLKALSFVIKAGEAAALTRDGKLGLQVDCGTTGPCEILKGVLDNTVPFNSESLVALLQSATDEFLAIQDSAVNKGFNREDLIFACAVELAGRGDTAAARFVYTNTRNKAKFNKALIATGTNPAEFGHALKFIDIMVKHLGPLNEASQAARDQAKAAIAELRSYAVDNGLGGLEQLNYFPLSSMTTLNALADGRGFDQDNSGRYLELLSNTLYAWDISNFSFGNGRTTTSIQPKTIQTRNNILGYRPALIAEGKFDYMFGRVTSTPHNTDRSRQLETEFARVGVHDTPSGRKIITDHMNSVIKDPSNVTKTFTKTIEGKVVHFENRQSLFSGPGGFLQLNTTFKIKQNGNRQLTTTIPKGNN